MQPALKPETTSLIFLAVALAAGIATLLATRSTRREIWAGWLAALAVSALDFPIEAYAAYAGWWRLHGVGPVLQVPLVYPIGWVFFTFHFLMVYSEARRRLRPPIKPLAFFAPAGISIGVLWNYLGSRHLGTLSFSHASLADIVWVWVFLVTTGLAAYQLATRRTASTNRPNCGKIAAEETLTG